VLEQKSKMKKTKIFAAYLPQYHEIPENNEFWGDGFTDWVGVKNAKPQYEGHIQPKIPLNNNFYDLSDVNVLKWQAELAKKYNIDGFNIYHYWFKDGHKVLEKPAENLLSHPEIDINYFFSWDNTSWVRSWSNIIGNAWAPSFDGEKKPEKKVLLELDYGDESAWKQHFDYLLPFFKDERYLKINNKPVFALMRTADDDILKKMQEYWNRLAQQNGFAGVFLITGVKRFMNHCILDSQFVYQPIFSAWGKRASIDARLEKYLHIKAKGDGGVKYKYDFENVWKKIIQYSKKNKNKNLYFCGTVGYDDTPRRGSKAAVLVNQSPEILEKYFEKLYSLCCESNREFVLLTAWNEWGEGAYLEPDENDGYAYLQAIKNAVDNVNKNV
jgi:hypothetical protein